MVKVLEEERSEIIRTEIYVTNMENKEKIDMVLEKHEQKLGEIKILWWRWNKQSAITVKKKLSVFLVKYVKLIFVTKNVYLVGIN